MKASCVLDPLFAFDDAADDVELFFGAIEERFGAREFSGGDGGDEADTHVEGAHHLFLRDLAEVAEVLEDRQDGPGANLDLRAGVFGQDAGQVFRDAAAGDVGHAGGEAAGDELLNDVEIAAVGLHKSRAGFLLDSGDVLGGFVAGDLKEELAGERVAVGVEAGGRQSDEDVAGLNVCAGDHFVAVDCANDEASEVVFAVGIEAGHLGGFTPNEGAGVGLAGFGEAGDDGLSDLGVEAARGEVVEEEERRGALDGDVVDAVVDEVGTDGVVEAEFEGDFELGADAVCRADEDRVLEALEVEAEERPEATDATEDIAVEGLLSEVFDALFGAVAGGDVDACRGVGDGLGLGCVRHGAGFLHSGGQTLPPGTPRPDTPQGIG